MKTLLTLTLLAPLFAFAGPSNDKAYCASLGADVDQAACMKEQRNARAEKNLGGGDFDKNKLNRCLVFKEEADRLECYDRVTKGTAAGSVLKGGTITEHRVITTVPVSK